MNSSFAPCAAEELALALSEALSSGDGQEATRLCQELSKLSVPVSVSINSQVYPQDTIRWDTTVCSRVSVCDFLFVAVFKTGNHKTQEFSLCQRAMFISRVRPVLNWDYVMAVIWNED